MNIPAIHNHIPDPDRINGHGHCNLMKPYDVNCMEFISVFLYFSRQNVLTLVRIFSNSPDSLQKYTIDLMICFWAFCGRIVLGYSRYRQSRHIRVKGASAWRLSTSKY